MTPELRAGFAPIFLVNAAAGAADAEAKRAPIEAALRSAGRRGRWQMCRPAELAAAAAQAAREALDEGSAVVAVGGDGTLHTVAQAAHAAGCAMGVVPFGTFNYFARAHGIPLEAAAATSHLLQGGPVPVQVGAVNERVFLVNASLGLYPELLEDREAYKARFGRSRWVALYAAAVTLLRAQRQLRVHIELAGQPPRDVRTLALFVGNNRLQLDRFGVQPADTVAGTPGHGSIAAVMLEPVGTLSMLRLMLRGALGTLGDADGVAHFEFQHLVVKPSLPQGRRGIKVAFDGEVAHLRAPLDFRVAEQPLYLLGAGPPR